MSGGAGLGVWGREEPWSRPGQSTPGVPHRYTAASVIDTASKYKLLWKLPLEDADIVKGNVGVLAPAALKCRVRGRGALNCVQASQLQALTSHPACSEGAGTHKAKLALTWVWRWCRQGQHW